MANSRIDAGVEVPPMVVGASAHDYVVPQYTELGHKIRNGGTVGGPLAASTATQKMIRFMLNKGGERIEVTSTPPPAPVIYSTPVKKPRRSNKKAAPVVKKAEVVPNAPYLGEESEVVAAPILAPTVPTAAPIPRNIVVFCTQLGKIRVTADAVIENDVGLGIVFANENEVRFIPEQGNELTLVLPGNKEVPVMYLGMLLQWYNSPQQIMMFYKTEDKNA